MIIIRRLLVRKYDDYPATADGKCIVLRKPTRVCVVFDESNEDQRSSTGVEMAQGLTGPSTLFGRHRTFLHTVDFFLTVSPSLCKLVDVQSSLRPKYDP